METNAKTNQKEVLIIMPAYNEEYNIGQVLESIDNSDWADLADVLVMNDASTDHTAQIVRKDHHMVVTHIFNLGYGNGLQLGYKYAARKGYRYLIQMDADGQHDICNVPLIYEKLKETDDEGHTPDFVLGARFMEGSAPFKTSVFKKIAYAFFRRIIKGITGKRIADPTTGLQGLSRRAFVFCSKYNQFEDKYPDANVIIQMSLLGFRVEEIPAVMHIRESGVSMHSGIIGPCRYMIRMFISILAVFYRIKILKWYQKPIVDDAADF
ncbi:glycosyl transferase family 2 [Clostridia bacterium]|nr:glycosyl transferase family 2 [Clostridia bacterium]